MRDDELITVNDLIRLHFPQLSQQYIRYHISKRSRNGLAKLIYIQREKVYFDRRGIIAWLDDHLAKTKSNNFLR